MIGRRARKTTLVPRDRHPLDEDGPALTPAAHDELAAHRDDAAIKVEAVSRDGHFLDREADPAVLDPEARRAAGAVPGHRVHALPHHLGDEDAAAPQAHEPFEVVLA